MTGDYSELYLDDVMTNLGEMVEYATVACGMGIDEFWDMFLRSDESAGLRASTPFMFCGRSGTETAMRVISEADPGKELPPPVASDHLFPEYWCGWAVGFYQWYSRRPFAEIASAVPMSEVLSMYPALHGEPEERFAEAMDRRMPDIPRLRQVRESRGMSIAQLSERSGVPVAAIEDMECGRASVNGASGETILALSKALLCPMESLMEFNRAPSLDP